MYNYNYSEDYLMHYGIKGMKWGVRKARGHAGPGRYITRKRQLAGDKRDLKTLNKGSHLSVGLTKKRQAALDKRDKAALEKRIAENEKTLSEQETNKKGLSDKQKKALKVGAAVAGTALAAYGAYKLNKYVKDENSKLRVDQGKAFAAKFEKDAGKHMASRIYDAQGDTLSAFKKALNSNDGSLRKYDEETAKGVASIYRRALIDDGVRSKNLVGKGADMADTWLDSGSRVATLDIKNKAYKDYVDRHSNDSFVTAAKNVYRNRKKK